MHGIAKAILSICLKVCLSVKRMDWYKMKETCSHILYYMKDLEKYWGHGVTAKSDLRVGSGNKSCPETYFFVSGNRIFWHAQVHF